jgi:hypothetical protein
MRYVLSVDNMHPYTSSAYRSFDERCKPRPLHCCRMCMDARPRPKVGLPSSQTASHALCNFRIQTALSLVVGFSQMREHIALHGHLRRTNQQVELVTQLYYNSTDTLAAAAHAALLPTVSQRRSLRLQKRPGTIRAATTVNMAQHYQSSTCTQETLLAT